MGLFTMRRVKVHFTATSYPEDLADWRGLFIRHMAFALARSEEVDLTMWTPPGKYPPGSRTQTTDSDKLWLLTLMSEGGIAHLLRTRRIRAVKGVIELLYRLNRSYRMSSDQDLYHLNWLQTGLPLPNDGKPALITILGTDMKLLRFPLVKFLLRRVMRRRQVTLCPNAEWMEAPLRKAFGDLAEIQAVAFGIDPVWYDIERQPCAKAPEWLAVTRLTRAKLGPLLEWSAPLFAGSTHRLHLFGPMQEEIELPNWVHYHGPATPEHLSHEWFPKAHGLVTLSRHAEGRPQVMLEAMAAGLPIIASNMPAHAQLVQHGATGWLCDSEEDYAQAIKALEELSVNEALGQAARTRVKQAIGTWDDCAARYLTLYRELLTKRHA